jgi:hypothetical protein
MVLSIENISFSVFARLPLFLYIFSVQIPYARGEVMARSVRNGKLETRSARAKLRIRREPHWSRMQAGAYIGYRRLPSGSGSWIARLRDSEGRQRYQALGCADDTRAADGLSVFTFGQAQELARQFFARKTRELAGHDILPDGPFTVATAVRDYLAHRRRRGSTGLEADAKQAEARIIPALGHLEVEKLTAKRISEWHDQLARSPRRIRMRRLRQPKRPETLTGKTARKFASVGQLRIEC